MILLDWAYPGEGPVAHELAWYLALNRARLPVGHSKESTIDDLRSALERRGVDDGLVGAPGRPLPAGRRRAVRLGEGARRRRRAGLVGRPGPRGHGAPADDGRTLADAYTATGGAWQAGPGRIYDQLSRVLVDHCPGGVAGRAVLDLGAGTGAASQAAQSAGARTTIAVDVAVGMLRHGMTRRPPAAAGDSILPFRDGAFDAVVAAFSINHLDPAAGLAEAARVLAPTGGLIASAYAADDTHPVKAAVEDACRARELGRAVVRGGEVRGDAPAATVEDAAVVAATLLGDHGRARVAFPDLSAADLVAWRLGMAQVAGFVLALAPAGEARSGNALDRLEPVPPTLVRSCITVAWQRPGDRLGRWLGSPASPTTPPASSPSWPRTTGAVVARQQDQFDTTVRDPMRTMLDEKLEPAWGTLRRVPHEPRHPVPARTSRPTRPPTPPWARPTAARRTTCSSAPRACSSAPACTTSPETGSAASAMPSVTITAVPPCWPRSTASGGPGWRSPAACRG